MLKVRESAESRGITPIELCDQVSDSFKQLFVKSNIQFDDYIRTTELRHKIAVEDMWKRLYDKNEIYLGEFEGWYSISDETFLTSTQVKDIEDEKGNKIKVSAFNNNKVTWLKEPNYVFRLSSWEKKILEWTNNLNAVYPPSRLNEIQSDIQSGLRDLSVSRLKQKIQWGIEVPNDKNHIIYVWLDALTNYLTVCGYPDPEKTSRLWPADYHIVGKDIAKFHAIYWPAFLMAAGIQPPKHVIIHSHWTINKQKMSKSLGNVVDPNELLDKYGIDPTRYFLLRDGGISYDGDFSYEEMEIRLTAELANTLGNLIGRCTSLKVNPTGEWPQWNEENLLEEEHRLVEVLRNLPDNVDSLYKLCEFGKGIFTVISALQDVNNYITKSAPWKLVSKDGSVNIENNKRRNTILYIGLESVRISALLLRPVIPETIDLLIQHLGLPQDQLNPMEKRFGYNYGEGHSHSTIPKESFILYDDRKKKEERYVHKQNRK